MQRVAALACAAATATLVGMVQRVDGAPSQFEVHSLPGWDGDLPSDWYSGYIEVGATSGVAGKIHYILQMSEGDPATVSQNPAVIAAYLGAENAHG